MHVVYEKAVQGALLCQSVLTLVALLQGSLKGRFSAQAARPTHSLWGSHTANSEVCLMTC